MLPMGIAGHLRSLMDPAIQPRARCISASTDQKDVGNSFQFPAVTKGTTLVKGRYSNLPVGDAVHLPEAAIFQIPVSLQHTINVQLYLSSVWLASWRLFQLPPSEIPFDVISYSTCLAKFALLPFLLNASTRSYNITNSLQVDSHPEQR